MENKTQTKTGNVSSEKKLNLASAEFLTAPMPQYPNPWKISESTKFRPSEWKEYVKLVEDSRFFYRKDALTSTTLNKLVDIGINKLIPIQENLSDNEFRIFKGLAVRLKEFAEKMALEYLISGFVVPEIKFAVVNKDEMRSMGINVKKYDSLILPKNMWLRNPCTIKIKETFDPDSPSYFARPSEKLISFVLTKGSFGDGTSDPEAYARILALYPSFVDDIHKGKREFILDNSNDLIIRRRVVTDGPYPTPYLTAAIDPLKHKRNLRRMDYSVAVKVLSAILQIKIGNDEYPLTNSEEDVERLNAIKNQLFMRNTRTQEVENIFQLFTDHTVNLNWVFPDITSLLNEGKYQDINEEIIFALGFPRILITGESQRTGTSIPEYAAMSPVKTMENFREKILKTIRYIVDEVSKENNFKSIPEINFEPINLHDFAVFVGTLDKLFQAGALSREDYADALGYVFKDQLAKRKEEQEQLEAAKVPTFGENPFSRAPSTSILNQPDKNNNVSTVTK